jgi:UTP--glucose-1-phosphate uridylyltransferase
MLPIVDKPLIQYAVEEAQAAGIEHFIFVTGRGKTALEDHFDSAPDLERTLEARGKMDVLEALTSWMPKSGQISYTRQTEPLGLGHAVWCARDLVQDEPFAVILPDDLVLSKRPVLAQMIDNFGYVGGSMVAVQDVPREHTSRYGILDVDKDDEKMVRAKGVVEKPAPEKAPSTLSIIGRYILDPMVFQYLDRQERGAGNEIQLTDAIAYTIGKMPFHGYRFEGERFDCGDKAGFLHANVAFALNRPDMRDLVKAKLQALVQAE